MVDEDGEEGDDAAGGPSEEEKQVRLHCFNVSLLGMSLPD